jgi:hypothetical protein
MFQKHTVIGPGGIASRKNRRGIRLRPSLEQLDIRIAPAGGAVPKLAMSVADVSTLHVRPSAASLAVTAATSPSSSLQTGGSGSHAGHGGPPAGGCFGK